MSEVLDDAESEHEALLSFLYMCPVGVIRMNREGEIDLANPAAAQLMLPVTRTMAIANLFTALENCAPELRHMVADFNLPTGTICDQHRIFVRGSGAGVRVMGCSLTKVTDNCIMAIVQDITKQIEQERLLAQNDLLLDALVAGINDFALFSIDRLGRVESWNTACVRQSGFSAREVIGQSMLRFYRPPGDDTRQLREHIAFAMREGWCVQDGACERRDGSRFYCQVLITVMDELTEVAGGFAVVMRDITERRLTTDELRRLLTTDHLTGALNRGRFFDLGKLNIERCDRIGQPLSVLMLDVDHFKRINDNFGHSAGDDVLRRLVTCCRGQLREEYYLSRLGGEEFAVLLPNTSLFAAEQIAEQLRAAVAADASSSGGLRPNVTVSIGCATVERPMPGIDDVLKMADDALYRAKRTGRNRVCSAGAAEGGRKPAVETMSSRS